MTVTSENPILNLLKATYARDWLGDLRVLSNTEELLDGDQLIVVKDLLIKYPEIKILYQKCNHATREKNEAELINLKNEAAILFAGLQSDKEFSRELGESIESVDDQLALLQLLIAELAPLSLEEETKTPEIAPEGDKRNKLISDLDRLIFDFRPEMFNYRPVLDGDDIFTKAFKPGYDLVFQLGSADADASNEYKKKLLLIEYKLRTSALINFMKTMLSSQKTTIDSKTAEAIIADMKSRAGSICFELEALGFSNIDQIKADLIDFEAIFNRYVNVYISWGSVKDPIFFGTPKGIVWPEVGTLNKDTFPFAGEATLVTRKVIERSPDYGAEKFNGVIGEKTVLIPHIKDLEFYLAGLGDTVISVEETSVGPEKFLKIKFKETVMGRFYRKLDDVFLMRDKRFKDVVSEFQNNFDEAINVLVSDLKKEGVDIDLGFAYYCFYSYCMTFNHQNSLPTSHKRPNEIFYTLCWAEYALKEEKAGINVYNILQTMMMFSFLVEKDGELKKLNPLDWILDKNNLRDYWNVLVKGEHGVKFDRVKTGGAVELLERIFQKQGLLDSDKEMEKEFGFDTVRFLMEPLFSLHAIDRKDPKFSTMVSLLEYYGPTYKKAEVTSSRTGKKYKNEQQPCRLTTDDGTMGRLASFNDLQTLEGERIYELVSLPGMNSDGSGEIQKSPLLSYLQDVSKNGSNVILHYLKKNEKDFVGFANSLASIQQQKKETAQYGLNSFPTVGLLASIHEDPDMRSLYRLGGMNKIISVMVLITSVLSATEYGVSEKRKDIMALQHELENLVGLKVIPEKVMKAIVIIVQHKALETTLIKGLEGVFEQVDKYLKFS